jgi:hypothetical protein
MSTIAEFNTHRMLREYADKLYQPAAQKCAGLIKDNFKKAKRIAEWKKSILSRFSSLHISNITVEGIQGDNMNVNDEITVHLEISKGRVAKEEIRAEMVVVQDKKEDSITFTEHQRFYDEQIQHVEMELAEENELLLKYRGKYKAATSGKFNYGVRIMPYHKDVDDIVDLNLIYWG